jgi:hypothetical protein
MIDQLVASRGNIFFGCWFSTFTGYINRIRGYHSVKDQLPGYQLGVLPTTYYYATIDKKFEMHQVRVCFVAKPPGGMEDGTFALCSIYILYCCIL